MDDVKQLDLEDVRAELVALAESFGVSTDHFVLVPSVQEWARANGLHEANPFRQATAFPTVGLIVMRSTLTTDDAQSSSSLFQIGVLAHAWLAEDLRRYSKFLLLHEIAHLHGMLTEVLADEWALAELAKLGEAPPESWGE